MRFGRSFIDQSHLPSGGLLRAQRCNLLSLSQLTAQLRLLLTMVAPRRLLAAVTACASLASALAPSGLGAPPKRHLTTARRHRAPTRGMMQMKRKGKSGMGKGMGPPSAMVEQQRQYAEYQKQREASGLPSRDWTRYVKGPNSPTWYPAGSLGGDERSPDLIESYMTDWTKGFAKGGIDRGVASSLFPEKAKFVAQCLATYPQLKKAKDAQRSSEFGYKVPTRLSDGCSRSGPRPRRCAGPRLSEDMHRARQDNAASRR